MMKEKVFIFLKLLQNYNITNYFHCFMDILYKKPYVLCQPQYVVYKICIIITKYLILILFRSYFISFDTK